MSTQQQRKFSLVVWQTTPSYKEAYEQAQQRFQEIRDTLRSREFECTYLGSLRANSNAEFEVWLNDSGPYYAQGIKSDKALELAQKFGDTGWWTLDELADFAGPNYQNSIVFRNKMWDLGFRPSNRGNGWAKIVKDKDQRPTFRAVEPTPIALSEEEFAQRYRDLLVLDGGHKLGESFSLLATNNGMIFVALDANPFAGTSAETMWILGYQARQRCHLNIEQDGFRLTGEELMVGDVGYLLVKAQLEGGQVFEQLWPGHVRSYAGLTFLIQHLLAEKIKWEGGDYAQGFSFGELYTNEGWSCETKDCCEKSNVVYLTEQEQAFVAQEFPGALFQGRLTGGEAANFILQHRMGQCLCEQHAPKIPVLL